MSCLETLDPGIYVDSTWHKPSVQTPLQIRHTPCGTPTWHWSPSRKIRAAATQNLLSNSLKNVTKSLTDPLPHVRRSKSEWATCRHADPWMHHLEGCYGPKNITWMPQLQVLTGTLYWSDDQLYSSVSGFTHTHSVFVGTVCVCMRTVATIMFLGLGLGSVLTFSW